MKTNDKWKINFIFSRIKFILLAISIEMLKVDQIFDNDMIKRIISKIFTVQYIQYSYFFLCHTLGDNF
jgi:hypothetical protein